MNLQELIAQYDALLNRALAIIDKEPYWQYVSKPECARLSIDGDVAIITIAEIDEGRYDSGAFLIVEAIKFPVEMLTWGDERFREWQVQMERQYNEKQERRMKEMQRKAEENERAQLSALKAKYEK